jgi:pimeloyl-ACP methyl ester carboxylesterase
MEKHLLLLHGALGSRNQFDSLVPLLAPQFIVHRFNFSGHGGREFAHDFSLQQFVCEVLEFIGELPESVRQSGINVFGYSMGGYVAAMAQIQQPGKFARIASLATKWHWDYASAEKEALMLNPEGIEEKLPAFARLLAQRHLPNDWKELLHKTAIMMRDTGQRPPLDAKMVSDINIPALFMVGDRDKTVTIEETVNMFRHTPGSSLAVLPSTAHPYEKVDEPLLAKHLIDFFGY